MKEYDISNDDKHLGVVKVYNSIETNSLIEKNDSSTYKIINDENNQTYEISIIVSSDDDLYDKVSIYKNDNIFDEIEIIKKYNNIKAIKKDTNINIVIPASFVDKFNYNIENTDLEGLLDSKIHFINKSLENINIDTNIDEIVNSFENLKKSKEYEFITDEELESTLKEYINSVNEIIKQIETNSDYRYGKDFIVPIKINNE